MSRRYLAALELQATTPVPLDPRLVPDHELSALVAEALERPAGTDPWLSAAEVAIALVAVLERLGYSYWPNGDDSLVARVAAVLGEAADAGELVRHAAGDATAAYDRDGRPARLATGSRRRAVYATVASVGAARDRAQRRWLSQTAQLLGQAA